MNIDPRAFVESGAEIGERVTIEPFAVVKAGVKLEDGVTIKSHAHVEGNTTIGENTIIYPGAVIGTKTQDLKYLGETTYVRIGSNCEIRECVTINSSSGEGTAVAVGDNTYIMAYCHVAHNCSIGSNVVMSNNALLAGHVTVEDWAIIGGMTPVHQFVRIGAHAMVGGLSRVTHDVPPFTVGGGIPYKFGGINNIGLKRRGFSFEVRQALAKCYRLVYRSGLHIDDALTKIEDEVEMLAEVKQWLAFCRSTQRGILGVQGISARPEEEQLPREAVVASA